MKLYTFTIEAIRETFGVFHIYSISKSLFKHANFFVVSFHENEKDLIASGGENVSEFSKFSFEIFVSTSNVFSAFPTAYNKSSMIAAAKRRR